MGRLPLLRRPSSLSLSSPRDAFVPACPDELESAPGKTGHPSPRFHPHASSPISLLPHLP